MKKVLFTVISLFIMLYAGFAHGIDTVPSVSNTVESNSNINKIDEGEPAKSESVEPDYITRYENTQTVAVVKDNAAIRSFPYDDGTVILQTFDKGMPLNVIGEYNGFYLVQLARDDYAWIDKASVVSINGYNNSPANIENFVYEENQKERVYKIKLNKKVPYVLSESVLYETKHFKSFLTYSDGLDLTVYNVDGYPENKYEIHINRVQAKDFGFKVYYKNNNELVLRVKNYPQISTKTPLYGINIVLANVSDNTKSSLSYKQTEQIIQKLKDSLEKRGAIVSLAEENKEFLDTDMFIGVHIDKQADISKKKSNVSGYYYYFHSSKLASRIVDSLSYQTGLKNLGVKQKDVETVMHTEFPSVLLNISLSGKPANDENELDADLSSSTAKAITKGIERYFNDK